MFLLNVAQLVRAMCSNLGIGIWDTGKQYSGFCLKNAPKMHKRDVANRNSIGRLQRKVPVSVV